MRHCQEDLRVNNFKFTGTIFDIYDQSRDIVDFHNLHGKLEPVILRSTQFCVLYFMH